MAPYSFVPSIERIFVLEVGVIFFSKQLCRRVKPYAINTHWITEWYDSRTLVVDEALAFVASECLQPLDVHVAGRDAVLNCQIYVDAAGLTNRHAGRHPGGWRPTSPLCSLGLKRNCQKSFLNGFSAGSDCENGSAR